MLRHISSRICGSLLLACLTACQTPNPVPQVPQPHTEIPTAPDASSKQPMLDTAPVLETPMPPVQPTPPVPPTTSVQSTPAPIISEPDPTSDHAPVIVGGSAADTNAVSDEAVDAAISQARSEANLSGPTPHASNNDYFGKTTQFNTGSSAIQVNP